MPTQLKNYYGCRPLSCAVLVVVSFVASCSGDSFGAAGSTDAGSNPKDSSVDSSSGDSGSGGRDGGGSAGSGGSAGAAGSAGSAGAGGSAGASCHENKDCASLDLVEKCIIGECSVNGCRATSACTASQKCCNGKCSACCSASDCPSDAKYCCPDGTCGECCGNGVTPDCSSFNSTSQCVIGTCANQGHYCKATECKYANSVCCGSGTDENKGCCSN